MLTTHRKPEDSPQPGEMKDRRSGGFDGDHHGPLRPARDTDQRQRPHPYGGPPGAAGRSGPTFGSPKEDFNDQEQQRAAAQDIDARSPRDHDDRLRGPMRGDVSDFGRRHLNDIPPQEANRSLPRDFDERYDNLRPGFVDGHGRPPAMRGQPGLGPRGPMAGPRGPGPIRPGFDGPRGPGPTPIEESRRPFIDQEGPRRPFPGEDQRRPFNEGGQRRTSNENEGPKIPDNGPKKGLRPLMEVNLSKHGQVNDTPRDQEVVRPLPIVPIDSPAKQSIISDPFEDPRWSVMRGMLESDANEELVINGKPFELRMGTSRNLRFDGLSIDVAVDVKERGIRVNGRLVYKLGEPIKEVPILGKILRMYYHGLPKPIWLDGQQHEMRRDAPPRNVMVDGVRHGFQIDGSDLMILVDRLEKGTYGGPPRKIYINKKEHELSFQAPTRTIFIDQKSCELKLNSKIPCVIYNGKPHGIRFEGEPHVIFINNEAFTIPFDRAVKIRVGPRPMFIAFGGPCHEVIIDGKWFEVKFDNIARDVHFHNRHYSIRVPGPVPRVKVMNEMPANLNESRLLSSHKVGPGPHGPRPPMMPGGPRPDGMHQPNPQHGAMRPMVPPGNRMGGPPMMQRPMQPMPPNTNPAFLPRMGQSESFMF